MAKLEWEAVKPVVLRMYYTYKGPGMEVQCRREILTSNGKVVMMKEKKKRRIHSNDVYFSARPKKIKRDRGACRGPKKTRFPALIRGCNYFLNIKESSFFDNWHCVSIDLCGTLTCVLRTIH